MRYYSGAPDKCMQVIDRYLVERVSYLEGADRLALISEFKEWIVEGNDPEADIWTIPDLTDEGLCDFFKRAISKKY